MNERDLRFKICCLKKRLRDCEESIPTCVDAPVEIDSQSEVEIGICNSGESELTLFVEGNGNGNAVGYFWQYFDGDEWVYINDSEGFYFEQDFVGGELYLSFNESGVHVFRCLLQTCSGQEYTDEITVTVVNSINIIEQPIASAIVCTDGVYNPVVVATGSGTLSYQWQVLEDGEWVSIEDGTFGSTTYLGTNTSDEFNVAQENVGVYVFSCLISTDNGICPAIRSEIFTLNVVADPSISVQPINPETVCLGQPTTLISFIANGVTPLFYQWQYFNGSIWQNAVDDVPLGAVYSGADTNNNFVVSNINAGNYPYRCLVSSLGDACDPVVTNAVTVLVVEC